MFQHCYVLYNTYLAALKKYGFEHEKTRYYKHNAAVMCPNDNLKVFYEARRDDVWFGYNSPMVEQEVLDGDEIKHRTRHQHGHH